MFGLLVRLLFRVTATIRIVGFILSGALGGWAAHASCAAFGFTAGIFV